MSPICWIFGHDWVRIIDTVPIFLLAGCKRKGCNKVVDNRGDFEQFCIRELGEE